MEGVRQEDFEYVAGRCEQRDLIPGSPLCHVAISASILRWCWVLASSSGQETVKRRLQVSPGTNDEQHSAAPLVEKVDCVRFYVSDLDAGLEFYRDQLGHRLLWRTDKALGLGMSGSDAEIVLQVEREGQETDLKVDSADAAAVRVQKAGGRVVVPPFDIQIGRGVVVEDPWGNRMVLIDSTKGRLLADESGHVTGVG